MLHTVKHIPTERAFKTLFSLYIVRAKHNDTLKAEEQGAQKA